MKFVRKLLGLPTNEEIAKLISETVIKDLDDKVIEPLLNRLDIKVKNARVEIEDTIEKETKQIKKAVLSSAEMIKDQASKKVEKKMNDSYKKVLNIFK